MSTIPFVCKRCGSETFKVTTEPKTIEEFDGAVCANCGQVVSEDDIKAQALKIAESAIRDALRKSGL